MKNLIAALIMFSATTVFAQNETKTDWSDSDLTEFVWKTIGEKVNFRVCIVGSKVSAAELESKTVFELFEKLPSHADAVIVSSKEQEKAVKGKIDLKIFLAEKPFDVQFKETGSFAHWHLVANDGPKISKMTASKKPMDLVTPRSAGDKH